MKYLLGLCFSLCALVAQAEKLPPEITTDFGIQTEQDCMVNATFRMKTALGLTAAENAAIVECIKPNGPTLQAMQAYQADVTADLGPDPERDIRQFATGKQIAKFWLQHTMKTSCRDANTADECLKSLN